jgi:hypothetical protein
MTTEQINSTNYKESIDSQGRKYLSAIATLLENGLPASRVMDAIDAPLLIRLGEK